VLALHYGQLLLGDDINNIEGCESGVLHLADVLEQYRENTELAAPHIWKLWLSLTTPYITKEFDDQPDLKFPHHPLRVGYFPGEESFAEDCLKWLFGPTLLKRLNDQEAVNKWNKGGSTLASFRP
jgi:hypothetical protein